MKDSTTNELKTNELMGSKFFNYFILGGYIIAIGLVSYYLINRKNIENQIAYNKSLVYQAEKIADANKDGVIGTKELSEMLDKMGL